MSAQGVRRWPQGDMFSNGGMMNIALIDACYYGAIFILIGA